MGKRFVSFIVILSLCASTVVGALGLSLRFAYADSITDTSEQQFDYFRSLVKAAYPGHDTDIDSFFDGVLPYVSDIEENANYLVLGMVQGNNYYFCMYQSTVSFTNLYYVKNQWGDWYGVNTSNSTSRTSWVLKYRLCACESGFTCNLNTSTNISSLSAGSFNFRWSSPFAVYGYIIPCPSTFNVSGCAFYSSKPILSGLWSRSSSNQNLLGGNYSSTFSYDLLVFWLGEKRYLTIKDQSLIRQLWGNDLMEYVLVIESPFDEQGDFDLLSYQFHNTVLLPYSGVESQLENISPNGVYAIDITELDWLEIHDSIIYDFVVPNDPELVGQCSNIPLVLQEAAPEPGTNGTSDSYTTMWQEFNTYVSNYNTTAIVPDNLSSFLFGTSGVRLYPVDVSFPSGITSEGRQAYTPDVNIFRWKYSGPSDLAVNYDIMDVCIIPESVLGIYGLVYFYDESLQRKLDFVDYYDYKDLLESFDIIIIVPDDDGCLEENTWWQNVLPDEIFDEISNIAVSGSSSQGVLYTSDPLPGNVFAGFAIVTKRCIQRQQLYNFSDGISKFYKLMSDYVESEDSWKSSFLQWSASWFSAINTLNGSINGLVTAISQLDLSGIEDKLDRLIENTNEEESSFWYIPLWNFIKQFEPAAEDFVEGLQVYDNNWDNLPLLSPVPTIPLLPTISLGGG